MGKGGQQHTSCNHNLDNIISNIYFGSDLVITDFGIPEFFSYPKDKNPIIKSKKQTLKEVRNNNKKQKKQEKISNQFVYLNVFENDKNNISFSSGDNEEEEDDKACSSSPNNNNNNYKEDNSNIINNPDEIENDELIIEEVVTKQSIIIEEEVDEFAKEFEMIIKSMDGWYIEEGEIIEEELTNKKTCLYKRIRKHNKKEKVNSKRYVKAIEESKKDNKDYWIRFHITKRADKRPKHIKLQDRSFNGTGRIKEDSYEAELRKALSLSASEYDKQLKKDIIPLTQNQINDILNRELTAEDYELLLLLDTNVKPKTVDERDINNLPLIKFNQSWRNKQDICMICLNEFDENESLTKLPCDHIFHVNCISNWLSQASTKCPIDSIPVR